MVEDWLKNSFTTESDHRNLVQRLCQQMKNDHNANLSKAKYNAPNGVSGLDKIVAIDFPRQVVRVEANMTLESLVSALLPFHFLPKVVPSERKATVADAFASLTSASSSYLHGTFDCTVTEVEIILGNGQLKFARPDDPFTEELFYGSAGALNSLGLTTLFEICLLRAGPIVDLQFHSTLQLEMEVRDSIITPEGEITEPTNDLARSSDPCLRTFSDAALSDTTVSRAYRLAGRYRTDGIGAMHYLEAMQSNDFVEARLIRGSSGVVVSASYCNVARFEMLHSGNEYSKVGGFALEVGKACYRSMTTASYLFREDDRRIFESTRSKRSTVFGKDLRRRSQSDLPKSCLKYGLSHLWIQSFLELNSSEDAWVHSIIRPERIGRRMSLGVGCPFDYEINLTAADTSTSKTLESFLLDDLNKRRGHLRGFPYLHHRVPCQLGTAWVFHDDRWYAGLRSRWRSGSLADISERATTSTPLRFPNNSRL